MTLGYQDTFTDADDVLIGPSGGGHVPNVGLAVGYFGNTNNAPLNSTCKIKTNKARGSIGPFGGQPYSDFHTFGVGQLAVGFSGMKEVSMDVFPITSVAGSIIEILFQYQTNLSAFSTPLAEYYAIHLRCQGGGSWDVYASYGPYQYAIVPNPYLLGAPRFSPKLATVAMADGGAGLRFGATRYQNTRLYDFWHEPAGGGTRTFIGSFTFPEYADSTHQGVGFAFTGPGASTTTVDFDNGGVDSTGSGSTPAPPTFPSVRSSEVVGMSSAGSVGTLVQQFVRGQRVGIAGSDVPVWRSDTKRWVRPALSSGVEKVSGTFGNPNPISLYLKGGAPISKLVIADEIMARRTAGGTSAFFGIITGVGGGAQLREAIGFRSSGAAGANINWFAYVQADDGSVAVSQDLGVLDNTLHHLMLVLNGITKEIEWYIDRVFKYKIALPANVGKMLNTNEPYVGTRAAGAGGTSITLDCETHGCGGLITVER